MTDECRHCWHNERTHGIRDGRLAIYLVCCHCGEPRLLLRDQDCTDWSRGRPRVPHGKCAPGGSPQFLPEGWDADGRAHVPDVAQQGASKRDARPHGR